MTTNRADYFRAYRAKNREKRNEYNRIWRAKDPERIVKRQNYDRVRWSDPECRARKIESDRIREANPENKAKRKAQHLARKADPKQRARRKEQHLLNTYGLSLENFETMLAVQGNACANDGCKSTDPGTKNGWVVDHDHVTGKVRGILCNPCNVALGHVKDCKRRLLGLVRYLDTYSTISEEPGQ